MQKLSMRGFVSNGSEMVEISGTAILFENSFTIKFDLPESTKEGYLLKVDNEDVVSMVLRRNLPEIEL